MTEVLTPTKDILRPATDYLHAATIKALQGRVKTPELNRFFETLKSESVPAPISATATLTFIAVYGVVKCEPRNQPWIFDEDVWGVGATAISSVGFMYTAYNSWDAFFTQTAAFHVQGIAEGGGIFQINWFNNDGIPIGQYNGAAGGIGVFQAGGKGKWKRK